LDPIRIEYRVNLQFQTPQLSSQTQILSFQVWGCAMNAGARVDGFPLLSDVGWRPDLEALERLATPATKLIAITSPNNPVGTVLTPQVITPESRPQQ
jgi:selenocysteine lyase/cysteine desulfurase